MRPRIPAMLAGLAISLLLAAGPARAQGFQSVFSRDGTDVWAVGDAGVIYRSFSGGADWTSLTLGNKTLRDVGAIALNVVVVGDSGKIWRSQDSGGSWSIVVIPGAPDLYAVAPASFSKWVAVGKTGTIVESVDGGGSWAAQSSGSGATLRAVRFTDESNGWAVGDGGTVLHTTDGGAIWTPVGVTSSATLFDVDVNGSTLWVVGADATARKSIDGGAHWSIVNLKLDARADVRSVWLVTPSTVFLAGGGGFIRRSLDGGQTWVFPKHSMQAPIVSLFFGGGRAWACNDRNRIVLTSTDQDTTWTLPAGTTVSRSWSQKLPFGGNIRGSTISLNPVYKNTLYAAIGSDIYRSRNDGETWTSMATVPSTTYMNALNVSPRDSNTMVVAIGGLGSKRLAKTTNGGLNWTTTLTHPFGEFGIPIETDPDRPDTMYFGGDSDNLFRSIDRGSTWSSLSTTSFRSPCDIVVVPDSGNIILVGDGVTNSNVGRYWKSTNSGQSFTNVATRPSGTSEIPGMACGRLRNSVTFGTNWGSGGVQRSTDYGSTWPTISNASSTWGIDISRDDPNLVILGFYDTIDSTYLSIDGGNTFIRTQLGASNYSFYARDRATIFAEQANGIWKLQTTYAYTPSNTQTVAVLSPNGGENWTGGSSHDITWASQNLGLALVEYRKRAADPWQLVAEVPGYFGSTSWTVPNDVTSTARIRVRDAWDATPEDQSNGDFTITVAPQLVVDPNPLDFPATMIGSTAAAELSLDNPGSGPVTVTSVTSDNPSFWPGRTSFTVPATGSDTIGVYYSPIAEGPDSAHVTIVSDDAGSPRTVRVTGAGTAPTAVGDRTATAFALWQNQPNPFTGTTRIEYALPVSAPVSLEVFNLLGQRVATLVRETQSPGVHRATFGPGVRAASGERVGSLPSGVYFYRFQAGAFASTRKMLVMR